MLPMAMLYLIVALSLTNLLRMALYLISSDVYAVKQAKQNKSDNRDPFYPEITVILPAYNEERVIIRALDSVMNSNYPAERLHVMVANDGSKDSTPELVEAYKARLPQLPGVLPDITLLNLENHGKASALNTAISQAPVGSLVMCLDSDSFLSPNALFYSAQHFRDPNVVALSSNVNIIEDGTLLALVQRFEYLVSYQMKRGQALLNIEYIVGGIGSMFRRDILEQVAFYDTNTMTEDIDLTMKIIANKKREQRIAYAYDSIVYTEPAHSIRELMVQRYRWKFGRSQTFFKHISLFFSRQENHRKRVSWIMLPYSLMQDFLFFLEPLVLFWFLFLAYSYHDLRTLGTAMVVVTIYTLANVWASGHLSVRERFRLSYYAPPVYFLLYILSFAEYYALLKATIGLPSLRKSIASGHVTWTSPARKGTGIA